MQGQGDKIFDGHISGLTEWGIFVELDDSIIEGVVHLRDIEGDYYRFDEQRYEVYGSTSGHVFTLGDRVRVRVKATDLRRRTLVVGEVALHRLSGCINGHNRKVQVAIRFKLFALKIHTNIA